MTFDLKAAALIAIALSAALPVRAQPPGTEQLIGTFVGQAEDDPAIGKKHEQRDIVMEIAPVPRARPAPALAQRDPGRRPPRRAGRQVPPRRGAAGAGARAVVLLGGGRLRSLRREEGAGRRQRRSSALGRRSTDDGLDVFSFVILEDGTYELQASRRRPERDGVSLEFERIVDGEVVRHMSGHAVRAAE